MTSIRLKVRYLVRRESGYYWQPNRHVKALGFHGEALGKDARVAVARAEELNRRLGEARNEAPRSSREDVKALIACYRKSEKYLRLRKSSQYQQDIILDNIEREYGEKLVAQATRRDMVRVKDKLVEERGLWRANRYMKTWSQLMWLAWDIGWRADNIAMKLSGKTNGERSQVWAPEHVEAFCKHAAPEIALALRIALDIGQRPTDVRLIRWADYDGAAFTLRQRKTEKIIRVPVSAQIRALLASTPRTGLFVIMNPRTQRPYTVSPFGEAIRAARMAAGIPGDLQFRDLRRTAATELGAAGATDDEIRAVTGHRSRNVVSVYVRPDDRYAAAAQTKRATAKSESEAESVGKPTESKETS